MADVRGGTNAVKSDVTQASTAAWTSATGDETTLAIDIDGLATVALSINVSGTITAGNVTFEASDDNGTTWFSIYGVAISSGIVELVRALLTNVKELYLFNVSGLTDFRIRLDTVIVGAGTANIRVQASAAPAPVRGASVPVKFVAVNATADGDNTIISGVTGKRIRVIGYVLTATGAGNILLQDTAGSPVIHGRIRVGTDGGGASYEGSVDTPAFETAIGTGVEINNPAGIDTLGHITYVET